MIDALELDEIGRLRARTRSRKLGKLLPVICRYLTIEHRLHDQHRLADACQRLRRIEKKNTSVQRRIDAPPYVEREVLPAFSRDDRVENFLLLLDGRLLGRSAGRGAALEEQSLLFEHQIRPRYRRRRDQSDGRNLLL